MPNKSNPSVAAMGIDIGKNSFHVGRIQAECGTSLSNIELSASNGQLTWFGEDGTAKGFKRGRGG
jgi:hypothetical protein